MISFRKFFVKARHHLSQIIAVETNINRWTLYLKVLLAFTIALYLFLDIFYLHYSIYFTSDHSSLINYFRAYNSFVTKYPILFFISYPIMIIILIGTGAYTIIKLLKYWDELKKNKDVFLYFLPLIFAAFIAIWHYENYREAQSVLNTIFGQQVGYFEAFSTLETIMSFKVILGNIALFFSSCVFFVLSVCVLFRKSSVIFFFSASIFAIMLYIIGFTVIGEQNINLINASGFAQRIQSDTYRKMMSLCPYKFNMEYKYLILDDNYTLIGHTADQQNFTFSIENTSYQKACLLSLLRNKNIYDRLITLSGSHNQNLKEQAQADLRELGKDSEELKILEMKVDDSSFWQTSVF